MVQFAWVSDVAFFQPQPHTLGAVVWTLVPKSRPDIQTDISAGCQLSSLVKGQSWCSMSRKWTLTLGGGHQMESGLQRRDVCMWDGVTDSSGHVCVCAHGVIHTDTYTLVWQLWPWRCQIQVWKDQKVSHSTSVPVTTQVWVNLPKERKTFSRKCHSKIYICIF